MHIQSIFEKYMVCILGIIVVFLGRHILKSINPKGIFIGDGTQVLNGAMILSHDACRGIKADTHIGKNCVIGVQSIILPGITIGDSCVVGAGSVVTKDVDSKFNSGW